MPSRIPMPSRTTRRSCHGGRLAFLLGLLVLAGNGCRHRAALSVVDRPGALIQDYPAKPLRGYGTLAGRAWAYPDGSSLLRLSCENEDKARLTLAKYLSDLEVLPGVTAVELTTPTGVLPCRRIGSQGFIVALRSGPQVFVLTAPNPEALAALYGSALQGDRTQVSAQPEVEVPMWLDRWDRFGFRFYYRPWEVPPGQKLADYDVKQEFAFAAQMDRAGFLFWASPLIADTAEGLTSDSWWDWAQAESRRRKLPVSIQLGYTPQTWLANRFRRETKQKMPQFCGDRYGMAKDSDGGQGAASWCATDMKAVEMAAMQTTVRRYAGQDNVTSWLEPHSELEHNPTYMMLEYGPVADRSYRDYLRQRYGNLATLATRWHGRSEALASWDQVRVPELAAFAGWGPQALDLRGEWRLQAAAAPPPEWLQPGFDDREWPSFVTPGHDRTMLLPHNRKLAAVYRREFTLPLDWLAGKSNVWLYLWDLNMKTGAKVTVVLNGQTVGEDIVQHNSPHWGAYDVSDCLKEGPNKLALTVPEGFIAYRVYLSPVAPAQYPHLGAGLNAQWVDLCDWTEASRVRAVERSTQAIRQVDPNRGIMFAAPDAYDEGIKTLCERYGGDFHNTGYMSGFWADKLPMLMRSSGLPFSLEPGGPAKTLDEFKTHLGLYAVEGLQEIDYFIHIGDILWPEDIRRHFEENQGILRLTGKYHSPQAEVALLLTSRNERLTGWPWRNDPNTNLANGYWPWNVGNYIIPEFERDAVTTRDLASGAADRYKVLIDTNTSIMDEDTLAALERYVRAGGIFITYVQTGRHGSVAADTWPIARLTGYKTISFDRCRPDGSVTAWRKLLPVRGQRVFPEEVWRQAPEANGLSLLRDAPDSEDLLRWEDGSVAVGLRPLGRGFIVAVGAKFAHDRIWSGRPAWTRRMFLDLLDYCRVARVPASFAGVDNSPFAASQPGENPPQEKHARPLMFRHYLSNNGLYDLWAFWNSTKNPCGIDFTFAPAIHATTAIEAKTGQVLPIADLRRLDFAPLETKVFLTPRDSLAAAPGDWFALQRSWWRAPEPIPAEALPPFVPKLACDLSDAWALKPLAPDEDAAPLLGHSLDTAAWETRPLGVWSLPDHPDVKHGVYRRQFTVPASWQGGKVYFWFRSFFHTTFIDQGCIFLDGKPLGKPRADGIEGDSLGGLLVPGSTHTLAVEISGRGSLVGCRGSCWLSWSPAPARSLDLAGTWAGSLDVLHYDRPLTLPGTWDAYTAKRTITVPADLAGKELAVHVETEGKRPIGVLVNGKWLRRHHHYFGHRLDLVVTPWLKLGQDNEIEIVCQSGQGRVTQLSLDAYDPAVYP